MEFLGGLMGVEQNRETLALRPKVGWAVRDASKLDLLIDRVRKTREAVFLENEPYRHIPFYEVPGDLVYFCQEAGNCEIHFAKHDIRFANFDFCIKAAFGDGTRKNRHIIDHFKFCLVDNRAYYAYKRGSYDSAVRDYHWDFIYVDELWEAKLDKEQLAKPRPVVAKSFVEFLERLLDAEGEPFHLRPDFPDYGTAPLCRWL
jgi:hypothetical protein